MLAAVVLSIGFLGLGRFRVVVTREHLAEKLANRDASTCVWRIPIQAAAGV